MSDRSLRLLAWMLLGVVLGCVVATLVLASATPYTVSLGTLESTLIAVSFAIVGTIVAVGAPSNTIGWRLLGVGIAGGLLLVSDALVTLEVASRGSVPAASVIAWLTPNLFLVNLISVVLLVLCFPSGQLLTPRWRVVNVLAVASFVCWIGSTLEPGPLSDHPAFTNPFGIPGAKGVTSVLGLAAIVFLLALFLAAPTSIVFRFRRARGIERQQLKWVAFTVTLTVLFWLVGLATASDNTQSPVWYLWILGLCTIPVSIGFAVLRYRLYEIDRIISRTLVYGALTAILGAAYAGLVLGGQAVFASFAGGSNLAVAVSTLIVAVLFLPARSRVQRFVDRRFYRSRFDVQRTLEAFGARLREQVELPTLQSELHGVVRETMQPAHVSLWLRGRR